MQLLDPNQTPTAGCGIDTGVRVDFRLNPWKTVFSAACAMNGKDFAIGGDQGVVQLSVGNVARPDFLTVRTSSDVLSLYYVADNVLVAGQRNGSVDSIDFRVAPSSSGNKALVIRHPSAATHVKRVDDHKIIVNGLKNSLHMYDTRFLQPRSTHKASASSTPSVLQYSHSNEYRLDLGFDVDVDSGLVAAALTEPAWA
ncbi:MAG: hypothetical protein M1825_005342 [Sarcosagium campestre]|nr:MAG: hypothetical protein M1825_005342 [Sarcosagium campestre]